MAIIKCLSSPDMTKLMVYIWTQYGGQFQEFVDAEFSDISLKKNLTEVVIWLMTLKSTLAWMQISYSVIFVA